MSNRRNRYKEMERKMLFFLLGEAILFIFYLVAAGNGVVWLKVTLAIIGMLGAVLCLAFLYLTRELTRPRSLWMSVSAAALLLCILFSLILRFPSPNPYKIEKEATSQTETT